MTHAANELQALFYERLQSDHRVSNSLAARLRDALAESTVLSAAQITNIIRTNSEEARQ